MYGRNEEGSVPKNGVSWEVGIVARISGCASQKEVSLDDQVDHAKQEIADRFQGPANYHVIRYYSPSNTVLSRAFFWGEGSDGVMGVAHRPLTPGNKCEFVEGRAIRVVRY